MVHQWIVWCISGLCGVLDAVSVCRVVHQWTVWCISVLCGASVDCVVHQWTVWCISGLCYWMLYWVLTYAV